MFFPQYFRLSAQRKYYVPVSNSQFGVPFHSVRFWFLWHFSLSYCCCWFFCEKEAYQCGCCAKDEIFHWIGDINKKNGKRKIGYDCYLFERAHAHRLKRLRISSEFYLLIFNKVFIRKKIPAFIRCIFFYFADMSNRLSSASFIRLPIFHVLSILFSSRLLAFIHTKSIYWMLYVLFIILYFTKVYRNNESRQVSQLTTVNSPNFEK